MRSKNACIPYPYPFQGHSYLCIWKSGYIYTFIGNNSLWIKMNLYAICFTRVCVRLFLRMWALVFNVFTFLQIRKIEILPLLSLTSSTTLVTINELYGKSFALFFANFHLLSKWQLSNNKETLDRFNACFSRRNQWLTIQKTGYCFSLHNGKDKWLNIEVYITCHILGSMDTLFRVSYPCHTDIITAILCYNFLKISCVRVRAS